MSKKRKKKVNPRRVPATKADVAKAKRDGTSDACKVAWAIIFSALRDKHGWGKVRLARLWNDVENLSDSIDKGHVNLADLIKTLEDEAGIFLTD